MKGFRNLSSRKEYNIHTTVFLKEAIAFLRPRAGGVYIDATLGAGGHAEKLLEMSSPDGIVIGVDMDPEMIAIARKRLARFEKRVLFFERNFTDITAVVHEAGCNKVDGIVFDLGVSQYHFLLAEKGFSFLRDGPLDMRLCQKNNISAKDIINRSSEKELADIFFEYGEERNARRIAWKIVKEREAKAIETTGQLAKIVENSMRHRRPGERHPATRVFQALRIAVNNELENLEKALPCAVDILAKNARICVISFHSLEDRIVKNTFRILASPCVCPKEVIDCVCGKVPKLKIISKKPLVSSEEDVDFNPSARSAKLRVAEKI